MPKLKVRVAPKLPLIGVASSVVFPQHNHPVSAN
jgi:hypothetical protein